MNLLPRCLVHGHYHDIPIDLTERMYLDDVEGRLLSGGYQRGLEPPYESGTFTFKLAYEEIGTIVNTGDWLVLLDPGGRPYTLLHVDTVSYSVACGDTGSNTVLGTISASSWMALLAKVVQYQPYGRVDTVGTIWNGPDWAVLNTSIVRDFETQPPGVALSEFHKRVARIRLPASLGGGFLGDDIPVVHDEATQQAYAPDRMIDPITEAQGIAANLAWKTATTNVLEVYTRIWVPEPGLIELYPSLEYGGTAEMSPLAKALGARPVLIYTLKPWRSQPLVEALMIYDSFKILDDAVNVNKAAVSDGVGWAPDVVDGVRMVGGKAWSPQDILKSTQAFTDEVLRRVAEINSSRAEYRRLAEVTQGLQSIFTKVTRSVGAMKVIPSEAVRSMTMTFSDDARVNVSAISLVPGGRSDAMVDALPGTGLPIIHTDSVLDHGARVVRPTWPFFAPYNEAKKFAGNAADYLFAIAAQVMQFHVNDHRLASGTVRTDPLDAVEYKEGSEVAVDGSAHNLHRYVHLQAGEWFRFKPHPDLNDEFAAYATNVTHSWRTDERGNNVFVCDITYVRGSAASDELAAFGKVPTKTDRAATRKRSPQQVLGGDFRPMSSLGPIPGFEFGAWTSITQNVDETIRLMKYFALDTIDVFVNGYTNPSWHLTKPVDEIVEYAKTLKAAGYKVHITSWVRPKTDWVDGLAELSYACANAAVDGFNLDAEEPWTKNVRGMSAITRDNWAANVSNAMREYYRGDRGITHIVSSSVEEPLRGLLERSDVVIPQAYDTAVNTYSLMNIGDLGKAAYATYAKYGRIICGAWGMSSGFSGYLRKDPSQPIQAYRGADPVEIIAESAKKAYQYGFKGLRYWWLPTMWTIRGAYMQGRERIARAHGGS